MYLCVEKVKIIYLWELNFDLEIYKVRKSQMTWGKKLTAKNSLVEIVSKIEIKGFQGDSFLTEMSLLRDLESIC